MSRILLLTLLGIAAISTALPPATSRAEQPADADTLFANGNWAEAYARYRDALNAGDLPDATAAEYVPNATQCLARLGRLAEWDAMIKRAVAANAGKWRTLGAAAAAYSAVEHFGLMIDGEFVRGVPAPGGRQGMVNAFRRDRVRSLQLYRQSLDAAAAAGDGKTAARFLLHTADVLQRRAAAGRYAWRLQLLTKLTEDAALPGFDRGWGPDYGDGSAAPVDADNQPVLHAEPASWEAAQTDGERWRWLLAEAVRRDERLKVEALGRRADFALNQFGVGTLGGGLLPRLATAEGDGASVFALSTLTDDECLARLATGVKRFELPAEHHPVRLRQAVLVAALAAGDGAAARGAAGTLADAMLNRRQFARAAGYFRQALELTDREKQRKQIEQQIAQIEDAWGEFQPAPTAPAGRGATFEYRYRNTKTVELTAEPIDLDKLLADAKAYLREQPKQLNRRELDIENLGQRLLYYDRKKYVGQPVAEWSVELDPPADHSDRQLTVTTPLQKPGAYFVSATPKLEDGTAGVRHHCVLWVADTVLLRKPMPGAVLFFAADAVTGRPIAGANLELFAYRQDRSEENPRQYTVTTRSQAIKTDASGLAVLPLDDRQSNRRRWLAIARDDTGRLAYLGFDRLWAGRPDPNRPRESRAFVMTDRPVYRPGQKVQFAAWVQRADYGRQEDDASEFAHQAFRVELYDAKNEKVFAKTLTAGAYGNLTGEHALPEGAPLGVWRLEVEGQGRGTFRVEEYKKPEFEVTVNAADEAVLLGQPFTATIEARYYFGSPVTGGTVSYKVTRAPRTERWWPIQPWDWLYGRGYGLRPVGGGGFGGQWPVGGGQPEVVAEGEAPLDGDGTLTVTIDTALAKALHGHTDHRYQITAEVTDGSRRTITGAGSVSVAREPLAAHVWLDRGHYRVEDVVTARVSARKPDGSPAVGDGWPRLGKLRLLKQSAVVKGVREESEVRQWEVALDARGEAELKIKASEAGHYRVVFEMPRPESSPGADVAASTPLTIAGPGLEASGFVYRDLTLTPDKREYSPTDTAKLLLGGTRPNATVLLFERPREGVYSKPRLVSLQGGAETVDLPLSQADSPNIFVEAVSVSEGRVQSVVQRLAVPPASRVLKVEVLPSAEAYRPGQEATMKVRLTDAAGEPFSGELVLAVYDRSLDAIAGGSGVPDIRQHFWSWTRRHWPRSTSNLTRTASHLPARGQPNMRRLGRFGGVLFEEVSGMALGAGAAFADTRSGRTPAPASPAPTMLASEPVDAAPESEGFGIRSESAGRTQAAPAPVEPSLRKEFADTAFWTASLETDADGLAEVTFPMPENLTAWQVRVWGVGHGCRVGQGESEVVTRKDLLVRLQTPRFLVERDEVVISANVHNYLDAAKEVQVRLELDGEHLEAPTDARQTITVPAGGDRRVDWRLRALAEGEATVRAFALTDEESDAMQLPLPVAVHGALVMEPFSGVIDRADRLATFEFTVPEQRRPEQTRLEVRYSPTLAGAMLDALPYLIDYPHGCTEQTLNRFLPAVLTRKTLRRMNLDLGGVKDAAAKLDATRAGADGDASDAWRRLQDNPVFDKAKLDTIVADGLRRLTDMQLADGGWGWFSGYGERSSAHTTAVVVRGLLEARDADLPIVPGVVDRGVAWLAGHQARELAKLTNVDGAGKPIDDSKPTKRFADNLDALVLLATTRAGQPNAAMRDRLFADRTRLSPYGLSLLGLALAEEDGQGEKLAAVLRNLRQYQQADNEIQTTYLNLPVTGWWYWHGSPTETHAAYLKLLAATDPDSAATAGLVKHLLTTRRHATYWDSTRDTALVIEAMADYLQATGEGRAELSVEVWVDGGRRKQVTISPENLLAFDNRLVIDGAALTPGAHTLELRKAGPGRLYWNAALTNFSLEDDLKATGLDLRIRRRVYKLTPETTDDAAAAATGQAVLQRGEKTTRTEVTNLASVESGDLVEVELTVTSKNDYEYLILTDEKAAGFEPVEVRSGYNGNELGAYVEYRDRVVNLFVRRLPRGQRSVSYRLRAVTPGAFSALPSTAAAMYAPELRGTSHEIKLVIKDSE